MKRPRRTSEANAGSVTDSLPLSGPRRLVVSHCPGCCEPHTDKPTLLGAWQHPDFTRTLFYYLCRHCERRMTKAGARGRQRLVKRVEDHLEAMGATVGLERVGAQA